MKTKIDKIVTNDRELLRYVNKNQNKTVLFVEEEIDSLFDLQNARSRIDSLIINSRSKGLKIRGCLLVTIPKEKKQ